MIDIRHSSSSTRGQSSSRMPAVLFAALAFVVWDSGYYKKWLPSEDREDQVSSVEAALLIKSTKMTDDQKYIASSPVLDEIADERGIKFRVIDSEPGKISGSPDWLQQLFLKYDSKSPCIAVMGQSGKTMFYDAPSSVSEFRKRIGAK